jgi:hypothetical protein
MAWKDDENHPFAGIAKKLERADEGIFNLHNEITTFFKECQYPSVPKPNTQGWQEAIDYHKTLKVPKRFSVLSGEIVHHFRSCLDHVVWYFSSPAYRLKREGAIEFPVFRDEPLSRDDLARFQRKIEGVTNTRVLDIIKSLQPYKRGNDAINDPLCIIHDMDRFDKHRELNIVGVCASVTFPAGTRVSDILAVINYRDGKLSGPQAAAAQRTLKVDADVSPQVAFVHFGNRKDTFVVPALMELLYAMDDVIELFAAEI